MDGGHGYIGFCKVLVGKVLNIGVMLAINMQELSPVQRDTVQLSCRTLALI